jgi:hypothetical protein
LGQELIASHAHSLRVWTDEKLVRPRLDVSCALDCR